MTILYHAADEQGTCRLGEALARTLPSGTVVALIGTLGAGKTRLVQAVADACGVGGVVSPTFVLVQQYQGARTLCHVDAYRLAHAAEFDELGVDEIMGGEALVFVEWADRVLDRLPRERLEIEIEVAGRHARTFRIGDPSGHYAATIQHLGKTLAVAPGAEPQ